MFDLKWVEELFNFLLVALACPILIYKAFLNSKKHDVTTGDVLKFSLPVAVISLFNFMQIQSKYIDSSGSLLVVISSVWLTIVLYLHLKKIKTGIVFVGLFATLIFAVMTINPRVINIWNYVDIDQDPLKGRGIQVLEIHKRQKGSRTFTMKLGDGRQIIVAIKPELNINRTKSVTEIILKKKLLKSGIYTHTIMTYQKRHHLKGSTFIDIPVFDRARWSKKVYELGKAKIIGDN